MIATHDTLQPGDLADVARVDPGLRVVQGHRRAQHAVADRIQFPQQVVFVGQLVSPENF